MAGNYNDQYTSKRINYSNINPMKSSKEKPKLYKAIINSVSQHSKIFAILKELEKAVTTSPYQQNVLQFDVSIHNNIRNQNDPNNTSQQNVQNKYNINNQQFPSSNNAFNDHTMTNKFHTNTLNEKDMEIVKILAGMKKTIQKRENQQKNQLSSKNKFKKVINLIDEDTTDDNMNSFQQKKKEIKLTTQKHLPKLTISNIATSNNECPNITKNPSKSKHTMQTLIHKPKFKPSLPGQSSTTLNKTTCLLNAQLLPINAINRNSDNFKHKSRQSTTSTSQKSIEKNANKYQYPHYQLPTSTSNKIHLQRNSKSYKDNKPFQCLTCKEKFELNSSLEKHKLNHLKQKPFQCRACYTEFSGKTSLTKHQSKCKKIFLQSLKKRVSF